MDNKLSTICAQTFLFTWTHVSLVSHDFFFFQDCFPMRFKGIHYLNEPIIFDAIFAIVRPFMKEKILQRVSVCTVNVLKFGTHLIILFSNIK